MKCLVTGSNGLVGGNLIELLKCQSALNVWGSGRKHIVGDYIKLDLKNSEDVCRAFEKHKFDIVVHCASNINFKDDPLNLFGDNVAGTINLVNACLQAGVKKVINISSGPLIGRIDNIPICEEHPVNFDNPYHASKFFAESVVEMSCQDRMQYFNIRIPSPVGRRMSASTLFPIMLEKIQRGDVVEIFGNKNRRQNFLDIREIYRVIMVAINKCVNGGLYNLAADKSYSNLDLANLMIRELSSSSVVIDNTFDGDAIKENWTYSIDKIKNSFGYEPFYTIEDTIQWVLE